MAAMPQEFWQTPKLPHFHKLKRCELNGYQTVVNYASVLGRRVKQLQKLASVLYRTYLLMVWSWPDAVSLAVNKLI